MSELSEKVLVLSTGYLGPAAKVFFQRQTNKHMNGLPFDSLERSHLPELCKWVHVSAGLIIGNDKSKELAEKIGKL